MNLPLEKNVMKSGLKSILILGLICFCNGLFSQKISVDSGLTPQQLIENHLVEGCVEVSNITSSVNGSVNGLTSYGYFERDLSNFPFENGIMLTTGNATSGGNTTNDNILNEGEPNWGTDADLEAALGISNTLNATTIEFDFTSISNVIQFNYILASEEYFGNFPCEYSDGFAFLIREAGTSDPYTNIALIPGTAIPVNTNTIHDEIVGFCPAENETYFDGYGLGDTNYNGRTVVMTASANIVPNVQYHIKLIIADQTDENYDSAVFIEGNSFNPTVELGPDISTCAEEYTIDGDIENPLATYAWFRDGVIIPGETDPTLNVPVSGTYEVLITITLGGIDCIIEDSILVTLNSEQTASPLTDYELCDDASGDGIETFDLNTKDAEALAAVPPANYSISYHYSLSDAQNDLNPITVPIQNTSNPQTIFVRIEDLDSGCLAYTSFNLVVNPLPVVNSPVSTSYCDDDIADGSTTIDLTELDNNITQGDPNLVVTYHYTQLDAENGDNAIPSPYVNTLPIETIYIRIVNSSTSCFSTGSFTIEILDRPEIDPQEIRDLNGCEADDDGFAIFDLTDVIPDILAQLSNVTITFHETQGDAEAGINVIFDESNYENTVPTQQTIYIRIVDNSTGCYTIVPLELHTNLLVTGVDLNDRFLCDDESGDGIATFDLQSIADSIGPGIMNLVVTFYETESDMENQINPIDQSVPYVVSSSPQTLYVHLFVPGCERDTSFDLIVYPPLILDPIAPVDYCDTDPDGFTSIELAQIDPIVLAGQFNASATYYLTEADAETGLNPLPPFYTNVTNPQTIYTRVADNTTGCFDTQPVQINVIPSPVTSTPDDLIICDDDQDGFYLIDLDALIPQIVSDTSNLTISFHTDLEEAENGINAILTPEAYSSGTQIIYTRVESLITTCFAIVELNVIVNTQPEFPLISNFQNCETDGNQTADFIFNEKDEEILNGQTGKEVLYFETEADANARTNILDKDSVYNNIASPQMIYVRVENLTDQACYGVSSFILEVGSIPIFTPPTNFLVCDDISNDGFETFDLNEKITEIINGSPEDLELSFHLNFDDAENAVNEINEMEYTNIENPQQIYVRIENGTYCHAIAEFGLNVVQVPTVNLPSMLTTCDVDYDGVSSFDLTVSEFEILDVRSDDIVITYFESESDLENDLNPINDPANYNNISNPQTAYVKVLNLISGCYAALPLDLMVNLPPEVNDFPEIQICESSDNTYSLADATDILINDISGITINYFSTQADAENQINALGTFYTYGSTSDTIFIRADDDATGCYRIQAFDLIVNSNPIANIAPDMEVCDDDFDFEMVFDLTQQNAAILGAQSPAQFTVTYHEIQVEAENGTNSVQDLEYTGYDGQTIYARVTNNITGCYSVSSFILIVNRKPEVEIEEQVICLDNLPLTVTAGTLVPGDTYQWSTGENSPEIEIDQVGTYSVTVTTLEGCSTTTEFDVIESEQATIEITETVDFSDPNNITITISGIGNYLYILDDGEPQESNVFENVSLGYHTITVIDLNGCSSITTEVLVIDAPKFMTPNSDGYFDTWHIVGVETLPGTTIHIFDRYGKQLAHLTSETEGWDGRYNGRMMPANDYWFVANVVQGNQSFQVKGHFAIRR